MLPDAFELWTAGWRVSLDMAETSLASAQVIAARMPIIAAAAAGDRSHDRELSRMVGEKAAASAASAAALHKSAFTFWEAWANAATNGIDPATNLRLANTAMSATSAALEPIRKRATANARRLSGVAKRS